jgi:N-acetylmuramoyl-L-alanine amidase
MLESFLQKFFTVSVCLAISSCQQLSFIDIPSTNQNSRIDYLVIHATSESFEESLRLLSTPNSNPVSAHYLVPAPNDPSYLENNLRVYRLVDENRRAWHAGVSNWGRESSLNDRSIGIEVVNDFECRNLEARTEDDQGIQVECQFPAYPESQIDLLIRLIAEILNRYREIDPIDVVAHADIAPSRKSDPGSEFPWKQLYESGIGAWYESDAVSKHLETIRGQQPSVSEVQCALLIYGYPIEITGRHDSQSQFVMRAFQLHFRPGNYDGSVDDESIAILFSLNEKYRADPNDEQRSKCQTPSLLGSSGDTDYRGQTTFLGKFRIN